MSNLVMGLLVIQLVGGAYLFSFVMSAGQRHSSARATRLPGLMVFVHAVLGVAAVGLWVAWLETGEPAIAWTTLASLLLSVGGGLLMFARTAGHDETIDRPMATDPADVRVAEKQIPASALMAHGGLALVLVVLVLLVALGA